MDVAAAVAQADGYAVVLVGEVFGTQLVEGDHVGPVLVDVGAVGVVDHVRGEAAGRAQVDF